MKTTRRLKLQTYGCVLEIIITDDIHAEITKVYKKYNINEPIDFEAEGVVISAALDRYYLIIDKKFLTHNTIAHEAYHAVVRITEDRGITDEESQAWLSGYISEEIYQFADKKKFPVKYAN